MILKFKSLKLVKGWNLISIPISEEVAVNKISTELNFYSFVDGEYKITTVLKPFLGYMVKSDEEKNLYFESNTDDSDYIKYENKYYKILGNHNIIIIGAGPGGCMCSHKLNLLNENDIAIIEEGTVDNDEYKKLYGKVKYWFNAQNDSKLFRLAADGLMIGRGMGGGTLHFGLQYIDQNICSITNPELTPLYEEVNNITKVKKYEKNAESFWDSFYENMSDESFSMIRNKIYSQDGENRYTAADLVPSNVKKYLGKKIVKLIHENNKIIGAITESEVFFGEKFILASGAIYTPEILLRSGIKQDIGNNILDHAAITLNYQIPLGEKPNPDKIGFLQARDKDLKWQVYFSYLNLFIDYDDHIPDIDLTNQVIVTYSQSTNLSKKNKITIDSETDELKVDLDHFGGDDQKYQDILDSFNVIDKKLKELNFQLLVPPDTNIDIDYVKDKNYSIYHYHGTCFDAVDENHKLNNYDNIWIADLSVIENPVPGSTSVTAMAAGLKTALAITGNKVSEVTKLYEFNDEIESISIDIKEGFQDIKSKMLSEYLTLKSDVNDTELYKVLLTYGNYNINFNKSEYSFNTNKFNTLNEVINEALKSIYNLPFIENLPTILLKESEDELRSKKIKLGNKELSFSEVIDNILSDSYNFLYQQDTDNNLNDEIEKALLNLEDSKFIDKKTYENINNKLMIFDGVSNQAKKYGEITLQYNVYKMESSWFEVENKHPGGERDTSIYGKYKNRTKFSDGSHRSRITYLNTGKYGTKNVGEWHGIFIEF